MECLFLSSAFNVEDKPLALGFEELDEEIVVHQKFVMSSYSPETILNRHKYFTSKYTAPLSHLHQNWHVTSGLSMK